jgi:pimeloyl-ACP methyl ester carboxylesterase
MPTVLLINGFLAPRVSMHPLRWRLGCRGVQRVRIANMPPLGIQSLDRLAAAIDRSVDQLLAETGDDEVDLVGVSQGGLAALRWLQEGGAARTRRFVALGTPFAGTWFAALGVPLLGAVSSGVWQSLPTSSVLADMAKAGIPEGVEVTSVAIPGDPVAPEASCRLAGAAFITAPPTRSPMRHQALILSAGCADITARVLLKPGR